MNDNELKDQEIEEETSDEGEIKEPKQVEAPENPAPVAKKEEPKAESNEALATRKFAEGAKKKEKEILLLIFPNLEYHFHKVLYTY